MHSSRRCPGGQAPAPRDPAVGGGDGAGSSLSSMIASRAASPSQGHRRRLALMADAVSDLAAREWVRNRTGSVPGRTGVG